MTGLRMPLRRECPKLWIMIGFPKRWRKERLSRKRSIMRSWHRTLSSRCLSRKKSIMRSWRRALSSRCLSRKKSIMRSWRRTLPSVCLRRKRSTMTGFIRRRKLRKSFPIPSTMTGLPKSSRPVCPTNRITISWWTKRAPKRLPGVWQTESIIRAFPRW